jgi:hypothetical protein
MGGLIVPGATMAHNGRSPGYRDSRNTDDTGGQHWPFMLRYFRSGQRLGGLARLALFERRATGTTRTQQGQVRPILVRRAPRWTRPSSQQLSVIINRAGYGANKFVTNIRVAGRPAAMAKDYRLQPATREIWRKSRNHGAMLNTPRQVRPEYDHSAVVYGEQAVAKRCPCDVTRK